MASLTPLKYGKVVGRFLANISDGPDIDDLPEFPPLSGTIRFTAQAPKILVATADPVPATYVQLPEYYDVSLDEFGYLTWRNKRWVMLVAPTADTTNPSDWTWRVTFDLAYEGKPVPIAPFNIQVPEFIPGPDEEDPNVGSEGLVDLTLVSPVPASAGEAVVRGLSVVDVDLVGNALEFILDNGDHLDPVVVPAIEEAADAAAAAAASQSAAAASATAAQDAVDSFDLDIGTVTTGAAGSSASASVYGGPPAWTVDLTIPRGDTGAAGPPAPDADATTKGILQLAGDLGGTASSPTAPTKVDKFTPTAVKTTTYTAAVGELIACDASGGGFTVTLPSAPADKSRIFIKKIDTSANTVTINRGGGTDVFEKTGGATSLTLSLTGASVLLIYNSSAGVWYAQYSQALSTLDTRFLALNLITAVKTTTYTAAAGEYVPCDATSGGFTVTLPTAPADGSMITVKKTDSSSNVVTISRGGSDVFNASGGATSVSLTRQGQGIRLVYKATGAIWYVLDHISDSDARLSNTRTPTTGTVPYDMSIPAFGKGTTRATGTGDFPFGVKLQRAVTFSSVTYRGNTNGGSGSLIVELRKNGSAVSGSSATITGTVAATGGTATGTWAFALGDILTVYITTADGSPGTGLIADITGLA